jgi:mono/diheme cytochrome c family protein
MSFTARSWKTASALAFAALVNGCAASTAAEGGGAAAAPAAVAVTPEMIQAGRQVYSGAGNCQSCHGANGVNGRFGPNLADGTWLWVNPSSQSFAADIAALVRRGIPQPQGPNPMPAMGGGNLSDEQLLAVGAYVASLSR